MGTICRAVPVAALAALLLCTDGLRADAEEQPALVIVPGDEGHLSTWLYGDAKKKLLYGRSPDIFLPYRPAGTHQFRALLRVAAPTTAFLHIDCSSAVSVFLNGAQQAQRLEDPLFPHADAILVKLSLLAGDNDLRLEIRHEKKGRVRMAVRLLDGEFVRARDVDVVLPGASETPEALLYGNGRIEVERTIDPVSGDLQLRAYLRFSGGRPMLGSRPVTVRWQGIADERGATVDTGHRASTFFLLDERRIAAGAPVPPSVTVSLGKGMVQRVRLGVDAALVAQMVQAAGLVDHIAADNRLPLSSIESLAWRVQEYMALVAAGDPDVAFLRREVRDTLKMAQKAAAGEDPFADRGNELQRRGYRSSLDGQLHPYALYVPPGWKENGETRFPLLVVLHGLNGHPVRAISAVFGHPMGEDESGEHRARHPGAPGKAGMFVLAPDGFGNAGYHGAGEQDVLDVIDVVKHRYRIDDDRMYITGASMGGTGAARIALHHPDRFAAVAALCGYHNVRHFSAIKGRALHPFEETLVAARSVVDQAGNGRHVPLYAVHGTKDFPLHSRNLVEQYLLRGFDARLETPVAGHNVWDDTWKGGRIFAHFAKYRRPAAPRRLELVTADLRFNGNHWLQIDALQRYDAGARLVAHWREDGEVDIRTENAAAFSLRRQAACPEPAPVAVMLDGVRIPLSAGDAEGWHLIRDDGGWREGVLSRNGLHKRSGLSGPVADAEHGPLLFVYGTGDENWALTREVAQRLRRRHGGMTIEWPMRADVEITGEEIRTHSLVLVGTPGSNRLLDRLADRLPVRVESGGIRVGDRFHAGNTLAAVFIHPHPLAPGRYVVVHTAVTQEALAGAVDLPELLPDYVVYDTAGGHPERGMVFSVEGQVVDAGFFDGNWEVTYPSLLLR